MMIVYCLTHFLVFLCVYRIEKKVFVEGAKLARFLSFCTFEFQCDVHLNDLGSRVPF